MIFKHIQKKTFLNKPEPVSFIQLNGFTLFQTIQFSISTVFCLHTVKCKNSSISNNSVQRN